MDKTKKIMICYHLITDFCLVRKPAPNNRNPVTWKGILGKGQTSQ